MPVPEIESSGLLDLDRDARRRLFVRTIVRSVAGVVGLVVAYGVIAFDGPLADRILWRAIVGIGLTIGVVLWEVRAVIRSPYPALQAIEAFSIAVPMTVLVFAAIYLGISTSDPDAFSEPLDHVAALYLSMMTTTTIGFGDIAADSDGARIMVMLQMVANVTVLGIAAKVIASAIKRRGNTDD